ncbi:MAG: hypothetical protein CM15mP74_08950 [Halieaceae bacterium]|nr:MAG: hypothetical protein CM15mP74_08950 [Halieaceae bacterium]
MRESYDISSGLRALVRFQEPEPWQIDFEQFYSERLDQIARAETMGFDSVWLTEHHFCDDGYTPSPLVIHAAIAARTERMRLGTNLMLLPLADPVRIAEDAATLSLISGGRFDLGVGIGYRQLEFDQFGRKISIGRVWSKRVSKLFVVAGPVKRSILREAIAWVTSRLRPNQTAPRRFCWGHGALPSIAPHACRRVLVHWGIGMDTYVERLEANGKTPEQGNIILGCWAIIAEDPEARPSASVTTCCISPMNIFVGAHSAAGSNPAVP